MPMRGSSYQEVLVVRAGPAIKRMKVLKVDPRSRRDIQENSKLPIFGDIFGLKSV